MVDKKIVRKLLNKWDPLGVYPEDGGPTDEYDCLLDPIISILSNKNPKKDLIKFLEKNLREHMGLNPNECDVVQFVENLMK